MSEADKQKEGRINYKRGNLSHFSRRQMKALTGAESLIIFPLQHRLHTESQITSLNWSGDFSNFKAEYLRVMTQVWPEVISPR